LELIWKARRMLVVHGTKKLRDRVGARNGDMVRDDGSALGHWYATVLAWRPKQLALFVHDTTLLPVLMPLAPAATVLTRFPDRLAEILDLHGIPRSTIEREIAALTPQSLTTTANRSLVGILNEFTHLATAWRSPDGHNDLNDLSLRLAQVPCSPLYQHHVSPDHELTALLTHPRPG
jgi:hypothetical protein